MPSPALHPSVGPLRRVAVLFLLLAMLAVFLVAAIIFARAHVIILAEPLPVASEFILDVAREPGEEEVAGDALETEEAVTETFPVATLASADAPAEGTVRISSRYSRAQTLVASTRLLTPDGRLYRIKKTATVPANGVVEALAFADAPGPTSETADATFTIPGLSPELRVLFTVAVTEPFKGGTRDVRLITQRDVDKAVEVIKERAAQRLLVSLREKAEQRNAPFSGELVEIKTAPALVGAQVGDDAPEFTVSVKVKVTAVFYDAPAMAERIAKRLSEFLPYDRRLSAVEDGATALTVEKRDLVVGRANVRVTARGTAALKDDAPALGKSKLTGVTAEAAVEYLQQIEGVASASVKTSPFWSRRMPSRAERITIEVR